jgi:hypothetical protein
MRVELMLPEEPKDLKTTTRALVEEAPEEGSNLVNDARFVADGLWNEWGEEIEAAGMDRDRFVGISRSYADELRLWVMGERPWEHCVAGLRGRVLRRLPVAGERREALSCAGAGR